MSDWIKPQGSWLGDKPPAPRRRGRPPLKDGEKLETVVFNVLRCPACNSDKVPVQQTMGNMRRHLCVECGEVFNARWE